MDILTVITNAANDAQRNLDLAREHAGLVMSVLKKYEQHIYNIRFCLGSIMFDIPWSQEIYLAIREDLESLGLDCGQGSIPNYRTDSMEHEFSRKNKFGNREVVAIVVMLTYLQGSTCKRVEVGVKEFPIYEVQCM